MAENKKVMEEAPEVGEDLDLIFSDLAKKEDYEEYELPSRGKFYKDKNPTVRIRPLNFEDEKIMAKSKPGQSVDLLLSRCCEGIDPGNLLTMDKTGIFLKLRQLTFGDSYDLNMNCPACEEKVKISIAVSDFPVNPLPEDISEPHEIYLDELKRKIFLKFPRAKDEKYVSDLSLFHQNLWRFIDRLQIKDDRYTSDVTLLAKALAKLTRKDIHAIIRSLLLSDYGVDPKFVFHCPHCDEETVTEAPFGTDFFTENLN